MKKAINSVFMLICLAGFAFAAPNLINYQGMLTDNVGVPLTGPHSMSFKIFDTDTGGTELWSEVHPTIQVQNGSYNVLLGSVTPFDPALFDGDSRWLEVVVAGEALTPRQQMTSVPFALQAGKAYSVADGVITSSQLDPSVVTLDQIAPSCPQGQGLFRTATGWECKPAITPPPGESIVLPCYTGPAGTLNIGICKEGYREWTDSLLGACMGDVLPEPAGCNGKDNDCNSIADCLWKNPADLSDNISIDGANVLGDPRVAMDDNGNVVITWSQFDGSYNQIYKAEYRDGTWTFPTGLSDNLSIAGTGATHPEVAISNNGSAIIVWQQYDGSNYQVFKAEYRNNSWTIPSSLSDNLSPDGSAADFPQVAMDNNGNAVVTWQQSDGSNSQIFKAEYRNNSWIIPSGLSDNLSPDGSAAQYPQVAMNDNNRAIITWRQSNYIFNALGNHGSWSIPSDLTDYINFDGGSAGIPQVAIDNTGDAIITWSQNDFILTKVFKAEYRKGYWLVPSGWDDFINLAGTAANSPMVAMDNNGNAIILWRQWDPSIAQIFKAEYHNGVWNWPKGLSDNLSPDGTHVFNGNIAMDNNGNAVVTWKQLQGAYNQIYKAENRNGSWTIPSGFLDQLSPGLTDASSPDVAMDDNGNAIIVWAMPDGNSIDQVYMSRYGLDADADGANIWLDCDDNDPSRSPLRSEILCNANDDDCDSTTLDDRNQDSDPVTFCNGDCDDNNANRYPGNTEILCNGFDENCNGNGDDDLNLDGDPVSFCNGDCDDNNANRYPGNTEILCNGFDENCNGNGDDDPNLDGDPVSFCNGDCDDNDPNRYPGNTEICDGIDNNCNGQIDTACDAAFEPNNDSTTAINLNLSTTNAINDIACDADWYELPVGGPGIWLLTTPTVVPDGVTISLYDQNLQFIQSAGGIYAGGGTVYLVVEQSGGYTCGYYSIDLNLQVF